MTTLVTQSTIEANLFNSLANIAGSQNITNKTLKVAKERATMVNGRATGTINFDVATQSILMYNSNLTATGNFDLVIRATPTANLSTLLDVSESIGICLIVPNGSTPYYLNSITIDGVVRTPKYQSGIPFFAGNADATDMYNILIFKTANTPTPDVALYEVYVSQTKFA